MTDKKKSTRKPPGRLPRRDLKVRAAVLRLLRKQGLGVRRKLALQQETLTKEDIRNIHLHSRANRLLEERRFVAEWFPRVQEYFASGSDVDPSRIEPYPVLVRSDDDLSAALFRIASLWWSVPVSKGFGRRFRILIFDRSNGKLFGLLGMTDPVFNLSTRDDWIGWEVRQREERLANVMDAYVLGAVPPYNELLGAKFVALMAASNYTRGLFRRRYGSADSIILNRRISPRLALVTATSALGKSSIYNRLRLDGEDVFNFVGLTRGFGHFHVANGTFRRLREVLDRRDDPEATKYKFGSGPNYRFRVVRKALEYLQLSPNLLRHGVQRGVYLAPLASNTAEFLRGEATRLQWYDRPVSIMRDYWRERWLLPRAQSCSEYRLFDAAEWKRIVGLNR